MTVFFLFVCFFFFCFFFFFVFFFVFFCVFFFSKISDCFLNTLKQKLDRGRVISNFCVQIY